MNKRGFTLVELLAVIVLIGIIGLITVPVVSRLIKDSRKNVNATNYDLILNAAYDYSLMHQEVLPVLDSSPTADNNGKKGTDILFSELHDTGLLKCDSTGTGTCPKSTIIDGETKAPFPMSSKITITYYENAASVPGGVSENSKFYGKYLFTFIK